METKLREIVERHEKWLKDEDGEYADLRGADLEGANLRYANLEYANLEDVDLRGADLLGADLEYAKLKGAKLEGANLRGAIMRNADFRYANLSEEVNEILISLTSICPEGTLIGWKKCKDDVIVKLEIPAEAKRSNGTGRKCRSEYAKVLEVIGAEVGISKYDNKTEYKAGEMVYSDAWGDNRWEECTSGIHFFLTRKEAEEY